MINYQRIADSVSYYEKSYSRVEAPWWVSQDILNITKPADARGAYFLPENQKCLVASGEQSFLYMANKGRLPEGRYFTVTPCFRNESIGILSKKCFIKTELIDTKNVDRGSLLRMASDAMTFFEQQVPDKSLLTMDKTQEGFDIQYGGIEIGSYGIRSCEFLDWVYGTGCAEPRLSRAIKISLRRGDDKR